VDTITFFENVVTVDLFSDVTVAAQPVLGLDKANGLVVEGVVVSAVVAHRSAPAQVRLTFDVDITGATGLRFALPMNWLRTPSGGSVGLQLAQPEI
jgi:hypothetical protein